MVDSRLLAAGAFGGLLLLLNARSGAAPRGVLGPAGLPLVRAAGAAGVLDMSALAPGQSNPPDPVIVPPAGPTSTAVLNASAVRLMAYPTPPQPTPPSTDLALSVQRQVSLQQPRIVNNPDPPLPQGPTVWTRIGPVVLPPPPPPPSTLAASVFRQASLQRR